MINGLVTSIRALGRPVCEVPLFAQSRGELESKAGSPPTANLAGREWLASVGGKAGLISMHASYLNEIICVQRPKTAAFWRAVCLIESAAVHPAACCVSTARMPCISREATTGTIYALRNTTQRSQRISARRGAFCNFRPAEETERQGGGGCR